MESGNSKHIAGVDEVGMGPLAGPVVAAAVVFPPGAEIEGIDDSKALDEATRNRLDQEIRQKASAFAIGIVEVEEIDRINIYHAGIRAMQLALTNLPTPPQHILVDSRTVPGFSQPQNSFDKGDGINFSIASASIVAKVYRDRLMTELGAKVSWLRFRGPQRLCDSGTSTRHSRAWPLSDSSAVFRLHPRTLRRVLRLYYSLKEQGYACTSREQLSVWESEMKGAEERLSFNENKKLHLMSTRLWKRIARAGA